MRRIESELPVSVGLFPYSRLGLVKYSLLVRDNATRDNATERTLSAWELRPAAAAWIEPVNRSRIRSACDKVNIGNDSRNCDLVTGTSTQLAPQSVRICLHDRDRVGKWWTID